MYVVKLPKNEITHTYICSHAQNTWSCIITAYLIHTWEKIIRGSCLEEPWFVFSNIFTWWNMRSHYHHWRVRQSCPQVHLRPEKLAQRFERSRMVPFCRRFQKHKDSVPDAEGYKAKIQLSSLYSLLSSTPYLVQHNHSLLPGVAFGSPPQILHLNAILELRLIKYIYPKKQKTQNIFGCSPPFFAWKERSLTQRKSKKFKPKRERVFWQMCDDNSPGLLLYDNSMTKKEKAREPLKPACKTRTRPLECKWCFGHARGESSSFIRLVVWGSSRDKTPCNPVRKRGKKKKRRRRKKEKEKGTVRVSTLGFISSPWCHYCHTLDQKGVKREVL